MARKLTVIAMGLAVIGCGAPVSNGTIANDVAVAEGVNRVAPDELSENAFSTQGIAAEQATSNDGAARTIGFADGSILDLRALKGDAKRGLSDAQCAVVIGEQRIETIGTGDLDAYTCGALIEAGALSNAGAARRIGLIYRVSSPNAQFQTALVLVEQRGRWALDPESVGVYDDSPEAKSLDALAQSVGGAQ